MNYINIINTNKILKIFINQYSKKDTKKATLQLFDKYDIYLYYIHDMKCEAVYKFYIDNQNDMNTFENLILEKRNLYEFNIKLNYKEIWD